MLKYIDKMKNIDKILSDVKDGDIVLIQLERTAYVGYRWGNGRDIVVCEGGQRVLQSEKEGYLKNAREELLNPSEADIVFCSLDGFGYMSEEFKKRNLLVGINLSRKTMGGQKVLGYEVLRRTTHKEE
jgi:hypothetical protein